MLLPIVYAPISGRLGAKGNGVCWRCWCLLESALLERIMNFSYRYGARSVACGVGTELYIGCGYVWCWWDVCRPLSYLSNTRAPFSVQDARFRVAWFHDLRVRGASLLLPSHEAAQKALTRHPRLFTELAKQEGPRWLSKCWDRSLVRGDSCLVNLCMYFLFLVPPNIPSKIYQNCDPTNILGKQK